MRKKMPSLSHKNLPLAMFLETSDLGYPAWSGSKTEKANDEDIIRALGLGIVRFNEVVTPEVIEADYEYRVDTDVITAVTVSGGQSDPDNSVTVTFSILGRSYKVENVYYPEDTFHTGLDAGRGVPGIHVPARLLDTGWNAFREPVKRCADIWKPVG